MVRFGSGSEMSGGVCHLPANHGVEARLLVDYEKNVHSGLLRLILPLRRNVGI